ncbi:MAG: hypothetical protein ACRENM_06685 [Candidatus Dormibacteraceae bacterium]
MTFEFDATSTALAGRGDALRIVPLDLPDVLVSPPTAKPVLTYRGGPLLSNVEVFTIFWGSAWQKAPQSTMVDQLNGFFDRILTGPLLEQLAEYSASGKTIGAGRRSGSTSVASTAVQTTVTDGAIQHMLRQQIALGSALPQPGPNVLYFVYLAPGTAVTSQGSRSCTSFCGYHNDITGQIFYAVMPYAGCRGCLGGLQAFEALTSTSSHELCEAITDPIPGQGWYDDQNGEIGDICAWRTKTVDGYTVQMEWSNQQGACV